MELNLAPIICGGMIIFAIVPLRNKNIFIVCSEKNQQQFDSKSHEDLS
jgi:hypothetical protein